MEKCTHGIWNKINEPDGSITLECMYCQEKPISISAEEASGKSQAAIEKLVAKKIKELRER